MLLLETIAHGFPSKFCLISFVNTYLHEKTAQIGQLVKK